MAVLQRASTGALVVLAELLGHPSWVGWVCIRWIDKCRYWCALRSGRVLARAARFVRARRRARARVYAYADAAVGATDRPLRC